MNTLVRDDAPTLRLDTEDDSEPTTDRTPGLLTLLFELSLGVGLPPAAILATPTAVRPAIHSDAHAILNARELAAVLNRPTTEVGRGRVALAEIDRRLRGLVAWLDVFRVADRSGALVSLSVVRPDPDASGDGGATTADLWALAQEALIRHGVAGQRLGGLGDDAFLAVHGGKAAQVAWVAGARLATASVTCLARDNAWMVEAARSIAVLADDELTLREGLEAWPFVRGPRW